MKKLLIVLAFMGSLISMVGCGNTADGVGQDIDKAADAVKDATN